MADQILEMRKENEKKEKRKQEKKKSILKLQDHTCRASYFAHEAATAKNGSKTKESPKTVPNKKNSNKFQMNLSKCDTFANRNRSKRNSKNDNNLGPYRFSIELQKFMEHNENISTVNTNVVSMNSMENLQDPQKYTKLANNVTITFFFNF